MPSGFVYVLINTEYDGFVKVGKTTRPPVERAEELSRSSGVVGTFEVFFEAKCNDIDHIEYLVHQALRKHRRQKNREFFNVSPDRAAQTIRKCILLVEDDSNEIFPSGDFEGESEVPLQDDNGFESLEATGCEGLETKGSEQGFSLFGDVPWPKISNQTPRGFHTRSVSKRCPRCGSIYSQTLARGETIVRSPCCLVASDTGTSW